MNRELREQAEKIVARAIEGVKPDEAVRRAVEHLDVPGDLYLVAAGKAAWQMASAAVDCLPSPIKQGIVVTKHGHVKGEIPGVTCYEGGHPVPDEDGIRGTREVLRMTEHLGGDDTVLFLLSGGGSALFEKPRIPLEELQEITGQLLASGADITEMNVIRKRLSDVKGGRFGQWCAPAKVHSVILSDIVGDPLDMIASGPTVPDGSTCDEAAAIVRKYHLQLGERAAACLAEETPKTLDNVTCQVTGSVRELCAHAQKACEELGYETVLLTDRLTCEARQAGELLVNQLQMYLDSGRRIALIAGGETVVHLTGKGLGGRNQELALSVADAIAGRSDVAVFSVGSDGTDGPTDAAGGYVDGDTAPLLKEQGILIRDVLQDNDAYHALEKSGGLIITGPTGTNVNDVAVALVCP